VALWNPVASICLCTTVSSQSIPGHQSSEALWGQQHEPNKQRQQFQLDQHPDRLRNIHQRRKPVSPLCQLRPFVRVSPY
jgi:hypothetical protein